ncbi:MAG TPA: ATP-binding protein [Segetibacter sp.]
MKKESIPETVEHSFLQGGGAMGELARGFDWSRSSIGSPSNWPQSLRTAVNIILNSRFPMFIWWGKEMTMIYNDAYREIMGDKHPKSFARPGMEIWSEIWDVVGPLSESVLLEGKSTWSEDQLLFINRHGYEEESYFTFSYSPIQNELGTISGVFCAVTETTEKVLGRKRLAQNVQTLRNIILQAPVAMCILTGADFVIDIANSNMCKVWGKQAEEVMNKPLFEVLPEAKDQGFEEIMFEVLRTGVGFSASEQPVTLQRNGKLELVYVNLAYEPIRDENNIISSIMALAIDVTEQVIARKKIEEIVEQRTRQLADANRALSKANQDLTSSNISLEQFGYAASHDMQEPLRKIQTFTNLLEREGADGLSEKGRMLVNKIGRSAFRMKTIINDLLQYSNQKVDDHTPEAVDLNEIATQVLSDLELIVEQNKVQIQVDELPTLKAIPSQINQLFYNLIINSIKFAKKDERVNIHIFSKILSVHEVRERKTLSHDKEYIQISFVDNGIGFEPEYAEKIFQLFTRLHSKNEYEGSGIGLGLCKRIVQNHDGDIYAVSANGNGATFHVILPTN